MGSICNSNLFFSVCHSFYYIFKLQATVLLTKMLSLWLAKLKNIWNFATTKLLIFNVRFWQHKCLPCSNVFMMHTRWFILLYTLDSVVPLHEIISLHSYLKEIWIFAPIQQGPEKTWSCFALNTEQQYWTVTVQYLCRVKKMSMTSKVLPFTLFP